MLTKSRKSTTSPNTNKSERENDLRIGRPGGQAKTFRVKSALRAGDDVTHQNTCGHGNGLHGNMQE